MSDLDVAFAINTPLGWVEIEDPINGYELHAEAFAQRSVSHRKTDVSNDWTQGTYTSRSVLDNITEQVDFYVGGATTFECRARLKVVTDAFDSLRYQARYRMEDYQETWSCTVADYTLEANQPLAYAKLVLVRAKIPRHPVALVEQVVAP
jgi:hypothetical protein